VNRLRGTQSAKGMKGILIRVGDSHVFRVYNEDYTFLDYDILHYDLEIQILDDAVLYRSEYGSYLDYPPIDESKL
jgi:hypothetical protein